MIERVRNISVVAEKHECPWCGNTDPGIISSLIAESLLKDEKQRFDFIRRVVFLEAVGSQEEEIARIMSTGIMAVGRQNIYKRALIITSDICSKCLRDYNIRIEVGDVLYASVDLRPKQGSIPMG